MSRTAKNLFAIAAAAALTGAAGRSSAEDKRVFTGETNRDRPARVIWIGEASHGEESAAIEQALRSQLADLDVELKMVRVEQLPPELRAQSLLAEQLAADTSALAVLWCDLGRPDAIHLYLQVPSSDRVVARRFSGIGRAGLIEGVALVARNAVDSLLSGKTIESSEQIVRDKPRPPALVPLSTNAAEKAGKQAQLARPEEPPRVLAEAAYRLDTYSADYLVLQGLSLLVEARISAGLSALAGYTFAVTQLQARGAGVRLDLRRHPIWLGAKYSWNFERLSVAVAAIADLDYVSEEVEADLPYRRLSTSGEMQSAAVLLAMGRVSLTRRLGIFTAAGAEIPFDRPRYVVEKNGAKLVVIQSWPVRPLVLVGLQMVLF